MNHKMQETIIEDIYNQVYYWNSLIYVNNNNNNNKVQCFTFVYLNNEDAGLFLWYCYWNLDLNLHTFYTLPRINP